MPSVGRLVIAAGLLAFTLIPCARPTAAGPASAPAAATTFADGWSGVLLPGQTALIKSKYEERVAEAPVPAGRRVKRDQVLLRFMDDEYRVECDRAAAVLERSTAEFKRADELHGQGSISRDDFEKAETTLKLAKADLELARIRLRERTVRAPFDGVLAERFVDPGASVKDGDPLLRVTSTSPLRVEALLPEEALPRLKAASRVEVRLASPDTTLVLRLRNLPVVVDPASGMLQLRLDVDNARGRLTPGVSCRVRIPERRR